MSGQTAGERGGFPCRPQEEPGVCGVRAGVGLHRGDEVSFEIRGCIVMLFVFYARAEMKWSEHFITCAQNGNDDQHFHHSPKRV